MNEVYLTVQRCNYGYYNDNYGVMPSDVPISNFNDFSLVPLFVCEIRFPQSITANLEYRASTNYFIDSSVDFVSWIAGTINEDKKLRKERVALIIDPKTSKALTDEFHWGISNVLGVDVVIGDRSNRRHTAHFRQCQIPIDSVSFDVDSDEIKAFPEEPLGLTITQLNRNACSYRPLLNMEGNAQIDLSAKSLIIECKSAVYVDPNIGLAWKKAERVNGAYGTLTRHGVILANESNSLHPRNRFMEHLDPDCLDSDMIRGMLSLIPNLEGFASTLKKISINLPNIDEIKTELTKLKTGKTKALYTDLLEAISVMYRRNWYVSSVFHVGKAKKSTFEDIVIISTAGWDFEYVYFLSASENFDQTPLIALFDRYGDYYAFVAPQSCVGSDKLCEMLGDFDDSVCRMMVNKSLYAQLRNVTSGMMPEELIGVISACLNGRE